MGHHQLMKLKDYLSQNDISVETFAESIGVTRFAIYKWTAGVRVPRREVIEKIADVTGGSVTPNDFFAEQPSSSPAEQAR